MAARQKQKEPIPSEFGVLTLSGSCKSVQTSIERSGVAIAILFSYGAQSCLLRIPNRGAEEPLEGENQQEPIIGNSVTLAVNEQTVEDLSQGIGLVSLICVPLVQEGDTQTGEDPINDSVLKHYEQQAAQYYLGMGKQGKGKEASQPAFPEPPQGAALIPLSPLLCGMKVHESFTLSSPVGLPVDEGKGKKKPTTPKKQTRTVAGQAKPSTEQGEQQIITLSVRLTIVGSNKEGQRPFLPQRLREMFNPLVIDVGEVTNFPLPCPGMTQLERERLFQPVQVEVKVFGASYLSSPIHYAGLVEIGRSGYARPFKVPVTCVLLIERLQQQSKENLLRHLAAPNASLSVVIRHAHVNAASLSVGSVGTIGNDNQTVANAKSPKPKRPQSALGQKDSVSPLGPQHPLVLEAHMPIADLLDSPVPSLSALLHVVPIGRRGIIPLPDGSDAAIDMNGVNMEVVGSDGTKCQKRDDVRLTALPSPSECNVKVRVRSACRIVSGGNGPNATAVATVPTCSPIVRGNPLTSFHVPLHLFVSGLVMAPGTVSPLSSLLPTIPEPIVPPLPSAEEDVKHVEQGAFTRSLLDRLREIQAMLKLKERRGNTKQMTECVPAGCWKQKGYERALVVLDGGMQESLAALYSALFIVNRAGASLFATSKPVQKQEKGVEVNNLLIPSPSASFPPLDPNEWNWYDLSTMCVDIATSPALGLVGGYRVTDGDIDMVFLEAPVLSLEFEGATLDTSTLAFLDDLEVVLKEEEQRGAARALATSKIFRSTKVHGKRLLPHSPLTLYELFLPSHPRREAFNAPHNQSSFWAGFDVSATKGKEANASGDNTKDNKEVVDGVGIKRLLQQSVSKLYSVVPPSFQQQQQETTFKKASRLCLCENTPPDKVIETKTLTENEVCCLMETKTSFPIPSDLSQIEKVKLFTENEEDDDQDTKEQLGTLKHFRACYKTAAQQCVARTESFFTPESLLSEVSSSFTPVCSGLTSQLCEMMNTMLPGFRMDVMKKIDEKITAHNTNAQRLKDEEERIALAAAAAANESTQSKTSSRQSSRGSRGKQRGTSPPPSLPRPTNPATSTSPSSKGKQTQRGVKGGVKGTGAKGTAVSNSGTAVPECKHNEPLFSELYYPPVVYTAAQEDMTKLYKELHIEEPQESQEHQREFLSLPPKTQIPCSVLMDMLQSFAFRNLLGVSIDVRKESVEISLASPSAISFRPSFMKEPLQGIDEQQIGFGEKGGTVPGGGRRRKRRPEITTIDAIRFLLNKHKFPLESARRILRQFKDNRGGDKCGVAPYNISLFSNAVIKETQEYLANITRPPISLALKPPFEYRRLVGDGYEQYCCNCTGYSECEEGEEEEEEREEEYSNTHNGDRHQPPRKQQTGRAAIGGRDTFKVYNQPPTLPLVAESLITSTAYVDGRELQELVSPVVEGRNLNLHQKDFVATIRSGAVLKTRVPELVSSPPPRLTKQSMMNRRDPLMVVDKPYLALPNSFHGTYGGNRSSGVVDPLVPESERTDVQKRILGNYKEFPSPLALDQEYSGPEPLIKLNDKNDLSSELLKSGRFVEGLRSVVMPGGTTAFPHSNPFSRHLKASTRYAEVFRTILNSGL